MYIVHMHSNVMYNTIHMYNFILKIYFLQCYTCAMNIKHCTISIRQYWAGEDQQPCNASFIYYLTYTITCMERVRDLVKLAS